MGHQVASHFGRRKSRAGKNCVIKCRVGGCGRHERVVDEEYILPTYRIFSPTTPPTSHNPVAREFTFISHSPLTEGGVGGGVEREEPRFMEMANKFLLRLPNRVVV